MTLSDYGIREFKEGDRAIFHYRPIEDSCPKCGWQSYTLEEPYICEVTILGKSDGTICGNCGFIQEAQEGFYKTDKVNRSGKYLAAPYTCLTLIEGE